MTFSTKKLYCDVDYAYQIPNINISKNIQKTSWMIFCGQPCIYKKKDKRVSETNSQKRFAKISPWHPRG